jgi:hypothetical protein
MPLSKKIQQKIWAGMIAICGITFLRETGILPINPYQHSINGFQSISIGITEPHKNKKSNIFFFVLPNSSSNKIIDTTIQQNIKYTIEKFPVVWELGDSIGRSSSWG